MKTTSYNKMKKKLFYLVVAVMTTFCVACQKQQASCVIIGDIPTTYNGIRIFLVPMYGPKTAQYVDSVVIENGHFQFAKDTVMLAKILLDYHYRMGVQELLVVTEPGQVKVTIDSVSHATGTPLNDSLDCWKLATEERNARLVEYYRTGSNVQIDSLQKAHKQLTRRMAENTKGTVLGDFLGAFYPYTIQRQNPDGTVVTVNTDTNEVVEE